MADMSFFPGASSSGGGSGGVSDYNQLANRPVTNITGTGVVISALSSGVYNIKGTWKITEDDGERFTGEDDLFYVLNTDTESKLTWISAGKIETFGVPSGGTAADIVTGETVTSDEVVDQIVGDF